MTNAGCRADGHKENSVTNRVVANLLQFGIFMSFDKGPFSVSAYRGRFRGDHPPLQMRICAKSKPEGMTSPATGATPNYLNAPPAACTLV